MDYGTHEASCFRQLHWLRAVELCNQFQEKDGQQKDGKGLLQYHAPGMMNGKMLLLDEDDDEMKAVLLDEDDDDEDASCCCLRNCSRNLLSLHACH